MEKSPNEDIKMLNDILSQGYEHIIELESHLYNHQTSFSENCLLLSSKVQSAFSTAIAMTKLMNQRKIGKSFKEKEQREIFKKRKTLPRWTRQVQAFSGSAMEMPLNDGYSWRKYGQKDILGAKFPRWYYRCTNRHSHGCYATKQVQRSDNNTSIFCITYKGVHTCNNGFHKQFSSANEQNINQNQIFEVKTEAEFTKDHKTESTSSFSFPSMPENKLFSSVSNEENCENLDWEIEDFISVSKAAEQFVFGSEFLL